MFTIQFYNPGDKDRKIHTTLSIPVEKAKECITINNYITDTFGDTIEAPGSKETVKLFETYISISRDDEIYEMMKDDYDREVHLHEMVEQFEDFSEVQFLKEMYDNKTFDNFYKLYELYRMAKFLDHVRLSTILAIIQGRMIEANRHLAELLMIKLYGGIPNPVFHENRTKAMREMNEQADYIAKSVYNANNGIQSKRFIVLCRRRM